jgi:hypothetical protein
MRWACRSRSSSKAWAKVRLAPAYAQGDMMSDKEALELVRSYYAIPEAQRRRLFDLARVLSEAA